MAPKRQYPRRDDNIPSTVPLYDQLQEQLRAREPVLVRQPQPQPKHQHYQDSRGRELQRLEVNNQADRHAARRQRKVTNPYATAAVQGPNESDKSGSSALNESDTAHRHRRQVTNPFETQNPAQSNADGAAHTQAANVAQHGAGRNNQRKTEDRANEKASCGVAMKAALAKGIQRVARRNTLVNSGNQAINMQESQNTGEYRCFPHRYDMPGYTNPYQTPQPPVRTFTLRSPWPTVMPPNYRGPILYPVINGRPDMEHPVFPGGFDTPVKGFNDHGPAIHPAFNTYTRPPHPVAEHNQPMNLTASGSGTNPGLSNIGPHQGASTHNNYGVIVPQQYGSGVPTHQNNINALQTVIDNNARILESFYALNRPDISRNQGFVNTSIPRTGSPKLVPKTPSPPQKKTASYHSPYVTRMDANVVQMALQEHKVMYTDHDDKVMSDIEDMLQELTAKKDDFEVMMGQLTAERDDLVAALDAVKLDIEELEKVKSEEKLRRLNPKASSFVPAVPKNHLPKAMTGPPKLANEGGGGDEHGPVFPIINQYGDGRREISYGKNLKKEEFAGKNLKDTFKAMRKQQPKAKTEEKGATNE